MEHAIVIPHLGASTEESEDNCAVRAGKEMMDYLNNCNIKNSVNYPDCDMGVCASVNRVALLDVYKRQPICSLITVRCSSS